MRKISVLPWVIGAGVVLVILVVLAVSLRDWLEADAVAAADEAAEANLSALGTAYVSDEFGYSAEFPGDPTVDTRIPVELGATVESTYATWEESGVKYEVVATQKPDGVAYEVSDSALAAWADATAASITGATVAEANYTYIDGHRAIAGLLSRPDTTEATYLAITVDGDVAYSIEIAGVDQPARALFVGSIRFDTAGD
jgi:hypothetical protein